MSILYGVTIGNNCIIAANAVVTRNVSEGSVVAGVPAKVIGQFEDQFKKYVEFNCEFKNDTSEMKGTLWEKQMRYFWKG